MSPVIDSQGKGSLIHNSRADPAGPAMFGSVTFSRRSTDYKKITDLKREIERLLQTLWA